MATLCRAYPSETAAHQAIERLCTAGLSPQATRLIFGGRRHDRRREPIGEFAGLAAPDAIVGTFGNAPLRRWRPAGTFAGDADSQRQGSFADVDQHVVVSHDDDGRPQRRVTGDRGIEALLRAAGLEQDAAEGALAQLAAGEALVLVSEPEPASTRRGL